MDAALSPKEYLRHCGLRQEGFYGFHDVGPAEVTSQGALGLNRTWTSSVLASLAEPPSLTVHT